MSKNSKVDEEMMIMGEEAFWDEFSSADEKGKRYVVVDQNNNVIVSDARLTTKKKKIKV